MQREKGTLEQWEERQRRCSSEFMTVLEIIFNLFHSQLLLIARACQVIVT